MLCENHATFHKALSIKILSTVEESLLFLENAIASHFFAQTFVSVKIPLLPERAGINFQYYTEKRGISENMPRWFDNFFPG